MAEIVGIRDHVVEDVQDEVAPGHDLVVDADGVRMHVVERVADDVDARLHGVTRVDEDPRLAAAETAGRVPDGVVVDVRMDRP